MTEITALRREQGQISAIRTCGSVVQTIFQKGTCTDEQIRQIREGRMRLREFIHELTANETGKKAACYERVLKALSELYPDNNYSCSEYLVRDLASACAVLKEIEDRPDEHQKVQEHLMSVALLCIFLRPEKST